MDGSNGAGPLDGLRLIDFGQYLAGPFGPMILADLGMDVIKVEPATGDGMRMAGKPFFGCQRGKRDIALNVKAPEGRELALELVRRADAVHHNMTKGTATKLGIDYEACKTVKPDIVYSNRYAYGFAGRPPVPRLALDSQTTGTAPAYGLYETQDGWVKVAALKPDQWDALCTPLSVDPSFARTTAEAKLAPRSRTRTAVSWSYHLD